jgi:hypothetical protein
MASSYAAMIKTLQKIVNRQVSAYSSLSEILCLRHNISQRSMYAKQDEQEETGDAAEHPEITH